MRMFSYLEPDENFNPIRKSKSEEEILEEYYAYWYMKVINIRGKEFFDGLSREEISEMCVQDWVTVNWAYEYNEMSA